MATKSLREASLSRIALRRDEAAASLGISPASFDKWVRDGLMPDARKVGGIKLWDAEQIRSSWRSLVEDVPAPSDDGANPFDGMVA